jgi:hypothetical protein
MKTLTQVFLLAFGLLLITISAQALTGKQKPHTDIHARYFYSAETVYREIVIDGLTLKLTYFNDADTKCQNWIAQSPCWTQQDLQTRVAKLSQKEVNDFVNLINQSEFLLLEKTYGGAREGQRYYTETVKVKLGEVQQEVRYQSFPQASPRPPAFTKITHWLSSMVKKKFKP